MMERSFLYRLHGHQIKKGVEADPDKFKEVYDLCGALVNAKKPKLA